MSPALPLSQRSAARIGHDAVQRVAGKPVGARQHLNSISSGAARGIDDAREPAAVGRRPDAPSRVDGERVNRFAGSVDASAGSLRNTFEHRAVGTREIEPAAFGAEPEVAARILGDRRDVGCADRTGRASRTAADEPFAWPGSRTFAPPSYVPIHIAPLRDSRTAMMRSVLSARGSPACTGIDSSCPSGVSTFSPLPIVPIQSARGGPAAATSPAPRLPRSAARRACRSASRSRGGVESHQAAASDAIHTWLSGASAKAVTG